MIAENIIHHFYVKYNYFRKFVIKKSKKKKKNNKVGTFT